MTTRGQEIRGAIFHEENAMVMRAAKLAKRTGLPVTLRSYTFDGLGRRQRTTCYEGHVMPDGTRLFGTAAYEWYAANAPQAMPACWR